MTTIDLNKIVTEKELLATVRQLAKLGGWDCYHTFNSVNSEPGFPDCVLMHKERKLLLFVELKTENGRLLRSQQHWLDTAAFIADFSNGTIQVYLWKPSDYEEIKSVLLGKE